MIDMNEVKKLFGKKMVSFSKTEVNEFTEVLFLFEGGYGLRVYTENNKGIVSLQKHSKKTGGITIG